MSPYECVGFLGMIRLLTSDACFISYSYNESTRITTALILGTSQEEKTDIENSLVHRRSHIGQEYLLPTIFVDVGLGGYSKNMLSTKEKVLAVESLTDQHTWQGTSATVHPTNDEELSKRAHGLKIEIAIANRKIEVISLWTDLLPGIIAKSDTESIRKQGDSFVGNNRSARQWIEALEAQIKMQKLDLDFLDRRTNNQIAAVSPKPRTLSTSNFSHFSVFSGLEAE